MPKIKKRGMKRTFSDADFEARANEFVKRAKENPDCADPFPKGDDLLPIPVKRSYGKKSC